MILTVEKEKSPDAEVCICFDNEGLELLIRKLTYLSSHSGHLHLMTPGWAGNELTEEPQRGSNFEIVNSLRLVRL